MAKLFATAGCTLDTVAETAEYLKDRISVLRWDAVYDNFKSWHTEKRPAESIPPHLREEYIKYCQFKKQLKKEEQNDQ